MLAGLARQFHRCKVVTASSGKEALAVIQNDAEFDAILCDLIMPLMSGVEFYEELILLNGELQNKVVFMTGGAFTPQVQAFLDQDWIRCLSKPFTWSDLLRVLMLPGTPDEISYLGYYPPTSRTTVLGLIYILKLWSIFFSSAVNQSDAAIADRSLPGKRTGFTNHEFIFFFETLKNPSVKFVMVLWYF